MCVGGNCRVNWVGGLSNHAPRNVSGIRGGDGVDGKPLITFHDCVMGLVLAGFSNWASSTGLSTGGGVGTLAGMLYTVEPAVCLSVSNALWMGDCSCWRGVFMDGAKGAGAGGALALARAACCSACSRSARVHGSSSAVAGVNQDWLCVWEVLLVEGHLRG